MKRLVEYPLEGGGSVVVQIDETDIGGTVRAARGDTIEQAKDTLEDALSKVLPAARSVVEKLQVMRPNEIEVTFGISLSFKAGAFITAGTDANFGVTVHWTGNTEHAQTTAIEGKSEPQTNTR